MAADDLPTKARTAVETAFVEHVSHLFATFCGNIAGGETLDNASGMFAKGLKESVTVRERALAIVEKALAP
jgi:hypothetical protein